ncbi:MAG: Mut7-C RNAse domain-containing protein [Methanocella sp.]
MRFLADGMLGGLTRWLRMLGQDVLYSTELSDNELLSLSKGEGRVLLTRDLELYKRAVSRGIEAFYAEGEGEAERLAGVAKRYGLTLEIDMDRSRCPLCNGKLEVAPKEQLKDKLQPNTYRHYNQFWQCPNCGQIYWQGSHWKHISQTIALAQQKIVPAPVEGTKPA